MKKENKENGFHLVQSTTLYLSISTEKTVKSEETKDAIYIHLQTIDLAIVYVTVFKHSCMLIVVTKFVL